VVISMGEYFDHAYYGIAHTKEGMRRKIPVLAANPANKLNYDDKEVPIFIVGNGPSLDSSIDAIKEWQGQAIIVSCGTTLQALHRHGITPDFHAEIEQNRSTYDWAVLIGDLDYLKKITLISCNGIHPDTCDLYKDVMIAFKEGESSTVSALNVLGRKNFTALLNAFPTVSNFAIDLFRTIGFTSIYLIGVDLGFVDVKHHHSKSSGYYQEDGKETYDFTKSANTSLIVPGNFRPTVNTKHEFKVSRQVIEQVTNSKPKGQEFYNCSDGARIKGTLPIRPDELLIVVTEQHKLQIVEKLKTLIFSTKKLGNYEEKFEKQFSHDVLIEELSAFETLLEKEVTDKDDAENIITKQKEMLFTSYKNGNSLLFYYLYGTVNYANAVLTKLHYKTSSNELALPKGFKQAQEKWLGALSQIKQVITAKEPEDFDVSSFRLIKREIKSLENNCRNCSILIVTDSIEFSASTKFVLEEQMSWIRKADIVSSQELSMHRTSPDYVVYYLNNLKNVSLKGNKNTIILVESIEEITANCNGLTYLLSSAVKDINVCENPILLAQIAIIACLNDSGCNLIIPKYRALEGTEVAELNFNKRIEEHLMFDNSFYISLFSNSDNHLSPKVSKNGTRMKRMIGPLKAKHLLFQSMNNADFNLHKKNIRALLQSKMYGNRATQHEN
jgi:hypothetical protein